MDILKDKNIRSYNYTCRYSPFPYYYNTYDDKMVYGLTSHLKEDTEYTIHHVIDSDTLDSLAQQYYGRPDLFWVIADFNRIRDSLAPLNKKFSELKIPTLVSIQYEV